MQSSETEKYAEDICDAVEAELGNQECTQQLVEAANKHFAGDAFPLHLQPSSHSAARWPILCAWRWRVRIPANEAVLNALRASDHSDTSDVEGPTDLAYRCVMPAALGYAIQKIDTRPRHN